MQEVGVGVVRELVRVCDHSDPLPNRAARKAKNSRIIGVAQDERFRTRIVEQRFVLLADGHCISDRLDHVVRLAPIQRTRTEQAKLFNGIMSKLFAAEIETCVDGLRLAKFKAAENE